ncbi:hypothetical protein RHGRI_038480 [Rhododendron griersonianum]|uniref:Uncharacterized protein n=1 Tax=Rhododendron griersonianum TaxID=479676 RepID=A0AAV6HJX7_9ERIC|nr:hypothetical protein RHGRI_038480 [Rhododendron griersonianum]
MAGSGKFNLGGDKESAQISEKETNSGLIEIKDNDWVAINGKETRMGDLLPKSKVSVLGGKKGVLGPSGCDVEGLGDNGPELCGGLGPVLSQENPNGAGSSLLVEANPLGHNGLAPSKITGLGPIESSPDLNLLDVVVSQSFDEASVGLANSFSFGAVPSKIAASSSGGANRSKGNKRIGVQSESKLRRSGKENSGVTGKKRLLNDEHNVKGTNLGGEGPYGGEKRLILCETNASDDRFLDFFLDYFEDGWIALQPHSAMLLGTGNMHVCQHSKKLLTLQITSNANNQSKKTITFMGEKYKAEILKDVSEEFKT